MIQNSLVFWDRHPALYLGCVVLIATAFALTTSIWILLPFVFFIWLKPLQTFVLGFATFAYVSFLHPESPIRDAKGVAIVDVLEIQTVPTHYGMRKRATVMIRHFQSEQGEVVNQKGYLYAKEYKGERLLVEGRLRQWDKHNYLLRAKKVIALS